MWGWPVIIRLSYLVFKTSYLKKNIYSFHKRKKKKGVDYLPGLELNSCRIQWGCILWGKLAGCRQSGGRFSLNGNY